MSRVGDFAKPKNSQPYTIKVGRQMADHTMVEVIFSEPDDARARERLAFIMDGLDDRMLAVNEKIVRASGQIEAIVDAKVAARMNGGADGDSHRAADLSANP